MRTIIQVYLEQDELSFLPDILKIWEDEGYYLFDNAVMNITDERLFIFARKEDKRK